MADPLKISHAGVAGGSTTSVLAWVVQWVTDYQDIIAAFVGIGGLLVAVASGFSAHYYRVQADKRAAEKDRREQELHDITVAKLRKSEGVA